jgi:hypothetical protein
MSYPNHADRYMAQRFLSRIWAYLYRYPVDNRKPLGTKDTKAETKLEILRSRDRLRMLISVGVGATALLVLLGAAAVAVSLSDGDLSGLVRSGFSAVYNSVATIAENLELIMAGVEKKMVQSAVELVEAGAAAWVMVQVLASVLASAGDSATLGALAWWQPRVASLLAGMTMNHLCSQANHVILYVPLSFRITFLMHESDKKWIIPDFGESSLLLRPCCTFKPKTGSGGLREWLSG